MNTDERVIWLEKQSAKWDAAAEVELSPGHHARHVVCRSQPGKGLGHTKELRLREDGPGEVG